MNILVMKANKIISFVHCTLFLCTLLCTSCNSFFSNESPSAIDSKTVFSSPELTEQAINGAYQELAKDKGYKVTRRHIALEELDQMQEAAACGTACVISPISKVIDPEKNKIYHLSDEPGPILTDLYHSLRDIQFGRAEDRHHWCEVIDN